MKDYLFSFSVVVFLAVGLIQCGSSSDGQFGPYKVSPASGLTTKESGSSSSFTVVLSDAPVGTLTLALTSSNTAEGTVSPDTLTFDKSNYQTAQTVTLTGVDDSTLDGDQTYKINMVATSSSSDDNNKFKITADIQTVTNTDDVIEDTTLVSFEKTNVSSGNAASNAASIRPHSISSDGRYIAFESTATNLVDGDTAGKTDIFLRDLKTGATTRVSVKGSDGGNGDSKSPSISADGRYVAFHSASTNLSSSDSDTTNDVYVYDTQAGTTTLISVNSSGTKGNADSTEPSISADGTKIAFLSAATNLAQNGISTTSHINVYVRDLTAGTTTLISVNSDGNAEGDGNSLDAAISSDGKYVAFASFANNIVSTANGSHQDVFRRDLANNTTDHISISNAGIEANQNCYRPSISSDGQYIAFTGNASNLVASDILAKIDIFVRDATNQTTTRVTLGPTGSEGNGHAYDSSISGDGRYVVYSSDATNLLSTSDSNTKTDIFSYDTVTGTTKLVSINTDGSQGNGNAGSPMISADGRVVVYNSSASNMVSADTNTTIDVFASLRL